MAHLLLLVLCVLGAGADSTDLLKSFGRGLQQEIASVKQPVVETVATIGSSQCSNVKKLIGVDYEQIQGVKEPDLNQLSLKFLSPTFNISVRINSTSEVLLLLPRDQKLFIFIHGFTDDPGKSSYTTFSNAFMEKGYYNVLALDGSSLIRWLYLHSTTYVRFIGEQLGSTLAKAVELGFDPANLHLVGHSLGSHIAGFTGKEFTKLTGKKLGRVTGLDPAGPCFSHVDKDLRLLASDAAFVDVIHTDGGVYGMTEPVGHVDFFPNSGSQQPNCLLDTCSHSRAWRYFSESVQREDAFLAVRCASWEAFRKGSCEKTVSPMGLTCQPGTKGLFFLQTRGEYPFGLGKEGIHYKNNEGLVKNLLGK